jgi:hypothetical protein
MVHSAADRRRTLVACALKVGLAPVCTVALGLALWAALALTGARAASPESGPAPDVARSSDTHPVSQAPAIHFSTSDPFAAMSPHAPVAQSGQAPAESAAGRWRLSDVYILGGPCSASTEAYDVGARSTSSTYAQVSGNGYMTMGTSLAYNLTFQVPLTMAAGVSATFKSQMQGTFSWYQEGGISWDRMGLTLYLEHTLSAGYWGRSCNGRQEKVIGELQPSRGGSLGGTLEDVCKIDPADLWQPGENVWVSIHGDGYEYLSAILYYAPLDPASQEIQGVVDAGAPFPRRRRGPSSSRRCGKACPSGSQELAPEEGRWGRRQPCRVGHPVRPGT